MSIPPLHPEAPPKRDSAAVPRGAECMDCGSTLGGTFCHYCGQRKQRRVATVFSLVGEFLGDILNWDSRVWRTLWPLFLKPGYLTKSFMEGKRKRHVPPVRLYLISSIIFFLLVSMSPRSFIGQLSSNIDLKRGDTESGLEYGLNTEISTESSRAVLAILQELDPDFEISNEPEPPTGVDTDSPLEKETETKTETSAVDIEDRDVLDLDSPTAAEAPAFEDGIISVNTSGSETQTAGQASDSKDAGQSSIGEADVATTDAELDELRIIADCDGIRDMEFSPDFEFLRKPAVKACLSISTWGGLITFIEELIEGLPTTLLVILPLMALFNKLLYLFAGRYYVEHLLYYVHNFSFLFLFTVVLAGIGKLANWFGADFSGFLSFAGTLYVIYYFFKSMRVVYGQGFFLTLAKWLTLVIVFFVLVPLVLAFFAVVTAALHGL